MQTCILKYTTYFEINLIILKGMQYQTAYHWQQKLYRIEYIYRICILYRLLPPPNSNKNNLCISELFKPLQICLFSYFLLHRCCLILNCTEKKSYLMLPHHTNIGHIYNCWNLQRTHLDNFTLSLSMPGSLYTVHFCASSLYKIL